MISFDVRAVVSDDRVWMERFTSEHWSAPIVVVHGVVFRPAELPGFIARRGDERLGLVTYYVDCGECEIVTLNSLCEGAGIGSALVEEVKRAAIAAGCSRLWVTTTNDNLAALRFYQKRGFHLLRVRPGAVDESRNIKPEIAQIGENGIPLRDEIELEMILNGEV